MKRAVDAVAAAVDVVLAPFVLVAAMLLRAVRRVGVERLPVARRILGAVGVFPVADHYYEPLIRPDRLGRPLDMPRVLPGIDLRTEAQLALLREFRFSEELREYATGTRQAEHYFFGNGYFDGGDAEFLHHFVRTRRPRRVVEIGSGFSTRLVMAALRRNATDDPTYRCEHVCIEPYEAPWLEHAAVTVLRQPVEMVDRAIFGALEAGDLLVIDSSHVIRPQGDVLTELLEVVPSLRPGVLVHVHDVFTPRDYPKEWVVDKMRLWNEQYLLEAFLTANREWHVVAAVNHLWHDHRETLAEVCPFLSDDRPPGSFYIERVA